jgi:hypothetical protein
MGVEGRNALDGAELVAAPGLVFVVAGVVLRVGAAVPTVDAVHEALYELDTHVLSAVSSSPWGSTSSGANSTPKNGRR